MPNNYNFIYHKINFHKIYIFGVINVNYILINFVKYKKF